MHLLLGSIICTCDFERFAVYCGCWYSPLREVSVNREKSFVHHTGLVCNHMLHCRGNYCGLMLCNNTMSFLGPGVD